MYRRKEITYGRYKEVYRYYPTKKDCPARMRKKKENQTPESMKRYNERQRVKKVQRLIAANFEGGWHLTMTYEEAKRPESMEQAKDELRTFLAKMRRQLKRAGQEFKWIAVTERGERGACHHHLIVQDLLELKDLIMKSWTFGRKNFSPLYEDGIYEGIAAYIVKKETKEENTGCVYSRSRNLTLPVEKTVDVDQRRWQSNPKPIQGYRFAGKIENELNVYTGFPYQHYTMIREERTAWKQAKMKS